MNQDSIILITGANSGIGKATAMALAVTGATIIMACRNAKKGQEAADDVINATANKKIIVMECDLSNLSSIRQFAANIHKQFDHLDVLVNNAGVILLKRTLTADGFEQQFGVNHLGHFLLTNLLLDLMGKKGQSRIVVVSSGAHVAGKIDFNNLQLEKGYSVFRAYAQSKLSNILFTYELARRLKGQPITVNSLHPGAVGTSMGVDRKTGFGKGLMRLLAKFFLTPAQGAETSVFLAASPLVEGITGKYFYRKKPIPSSRKTYDEALALKLWDESEKLTALKSKSAGF